MKLPSMTCAPVDRNPSMDASANTDHWRCSLSYQGRRMSVVFSMGHGHNGRAPKAKEVLESLLLDASSAGDGSTFEDFCSEFGYDTDSRTAERTFKACQSIAIRLRKLLGADYDAIQREVSDA